MKRIILYWIVVVLISILMIPAFQSNAQQNSNQLEFDTLIIYKHYGILMCIDTVNNDTAFYTSDGIIGKYANLDSAAVNGPAIITVANTTAGGETGAYSYVYHHANALTGELIGVRGNARVDTISSPSGSVIGGKFQAGNMNVGTNLSGARGVYVDVVNKIPSAASVTWDVARGYEVSMDLNQGSAGHTNTVTDAQAFYACYNLPTAGTYSTVTNGYGIFIRNEAVGGTGQMLDAGFYLDDRNHSGDIKGWNYGIDFSGIGANSGGFGTADIKLANGLMVFTGAQTTEDGVYGEVGSKDATGSIYLSSSGKMFLQVANNGNVADWETVTTSSVD